MSTRANPIRALPIVLAFLMNVVIGPLAPVAQTALVHAANDGINDYAQCMIGDGAGLDCAGPSETPDAWTNGILNDTHNDYAEDEVVPQRLQMTFEPNTSHTVTIRYMTRKDSSGQRHAYDYLATWNHTYVNADRCEDLPSGVSCIADASPSSFPIPSDPNNVAPGGPQPTSAHELPQANRQFIMFGGEITAATTPVHSLVDSGADAGSDYASITVSFTVGAGGQMQLLWGGHLASGFGPRGWGENLGAAAISGGPYHMIVDAVDGESIGQRDNQIMSNAIAPLLPTLGISKAADAATVSAGENIGFTITVSNTGEGVAENVTLNDPLPAGTGVNWDIAPAYAGPGTCSIAGNPPTETLSCSFGNLAGGASASVHVQSATTFDSCKEYPNKATAQATNFTPVEASASTTVLCPNLSIQKSTSTPTIYAGEFAFYTVTVSNSGSGTATGVFISDSLPSGLTWVEDPDKAECSISLAGLLSCTNITLGPSGAANSSFSVTVKGRSDAADCPSILNRATFGSGNDGSGQTHPEGQGVQVSILCPDTSVLKTGNGPITAGETATFTMVVTAGGTGTNQNVTLTDDLPAGLAWSLGTEDDEAACSIDDSGTPDVLTCGFGDLEPGATRTVKLHGVSDAGDCPSISNTAVVSSTLDTDTSDNSSSATITVQCGDIELEKTPDLPGDSGGTVNVGGVASFTITVTNVGSGEARGVVVYDELPIVANGWTIADGTLVGCSIAGDPGEQQILTCGPTTLGGVTAPSNQDWVRVETLTTAAECGNLPNEASATTENDGSDADTGAILVTCPELEINKSTTTPLVTAGEEVFYTIEVSNAEGDGTAEDVLIVDDLFDGIDWAEDPDHPDCSIDLAGDLKCLVDIPAGAAFSVTVSGLTDAEDCPSIENRATFTSTNAGSGESHEQGDGVLITINCPDVGVEKTAFASPINAGDLAMYTVTVTAGGTGASESVRIVDDLPAIDGTWSWQIQSPDADDSCELTGLVLECSFGDMQPDDTKVVTLSHTTTPDDCGTLLNDVEVFADVDTDTDQGLPGNSVEDVAIVVNCPDIDVDKTGSGTVNATDGVFFEITVSNDGVGDAYGFAFDDTLPDVLGGWTLVLPAEDGCSLNGLALTCSKDVFESGDSFTLRVEADTEFADCGNLENLASASATNEATDEEDPILDNNSDGHTIVVECPELTAEKSAGNALVSAGQEISFTIEISNAAGEGVGVAYDVTLNDPLPFKADGTVDWEIDPDNAACEITGEVGAEVLECEFGDLDPGESVSVRVVSDTAQQDCALFHNVATISGANHEELVRTADTTVQCPGLNIVKTAGPSPIDAGQDASFTVTVWNAGPGDALGVTVHDELPDDVDWEKPMVVGGTGDECTLASSVAGDGVEHWSFDCSLGDLGVTEMAGGVLIEISGSTDRDDCGLLTNVATANADNSDEVGPAQASVTVKCPTVEIEKVNDQPDPVLPGTVVSYTLTVTVDDGPADGVVVTDVLPLGLDAPTSISDGGTYAGGTRTISWNLGDLDDGSYELTYQAAVSAGVEHGDELTNVAIVTSPNSQCPDAETLGAECEDDSTVTVRVPSLVIDKAASTEVVHFVFDADGDVISVTPEQVTWTLTYTLANGPVTNAVISDPLPDFLSFVSASDGGDYDDASRTITWELGTLTSSGSVSFVTTVDPDAPETAPIVNVATIDSDETQPDDGEDSITVTSESELAGTPPPTPKPSVPNTALVFGPAGDPLSIPVELMLFLLIGSLGTLAYANVRTARRRR